MCYNTLICNSIVTIFVQWGGIMVITIARQYGSGGRQIGMTLAKRLGIEYYDRELINLAAKESGVSPEIFEKVDEKSMNSLLYSLSLGATATIGADYAMSPNLPINDRLFMLQHDIIRKVSQKPCVIVGRCADYILSERPDCVKVFIYADIKKRIKYAVDVHNVPKENAASVIKKVDKSREKYYNNYASGKWGDPLNYNLCINSGELGAEKCVELIEFYLRQRGMI